jgi:cyclopropane fatty-acyl-phospholipid synthase-like methyltransferase
MDAVSPAARDAAPSAGEAAAPAAPAGEPGAFRRYDYKAAFLDGLLAPLAGRPVRLLDLGSGTSKDFVDVLRKYPNVAYTGVEFRAAAQERARQLLAGIPCVTLLSGFGEAVERTFEGCFDVTVSLSVLEHVKRLDAFLRTSARVTASGGLVVHRYDLGHSLHSTRYEALKVAVFRRFGRVMPARHFTTHPDLGQVTRILEASGVEVVEVGYSQMPSLKQAMNRLDWASPAANRLAAELIGLEQRLYAEIAPRLGTAQREWLFPAVTVVGRRR